MKPQSALRKPVGRHGRLLAGLSALLVVLATAGDRSAAVEAAGTTDFRATYAITLAGTVIGRASAESRFGDGSYVAAIKGSTSGMSRMVTDATAALSGSGQIAGKRVLPASFELDTLENGFGTHVRMAMKSGRVTEVVAEPGLSKAPDRIPVMPRHKTDVVDPLGAFLVPVDRPGGGSISDMVDSERSEIWLVPVGDTGLMVPYRIVLGTRWGDLVVYATRFTATATDQRAALQ